MTVKSFHRDIRVPFGVALDTGLIVSVDEVVNGRGCNCICPSCSTPLIARQGQEVEWHFAHESRGTYKQAADACKLSLWVSLKLLARQLLSVPGTLALPTWNLVSSSNGGNVVETVTQARHIAYEGSDIETALQGVDVDASLALTSSKGQQFRLGVLLTYPSHTAAAYGIESTLSDPHAGFISIDLESLWSRYPRGPQQHLSAFATLLVEDLDSKRWLYHPNVKAARSRLRMAIDQRQQRMLEAPAIKPTAPARRPYGPFVRAGHSEQPYRYGCVSCGVQWTCLPASRIYCLQCEYAENVTPVGPGTRDEMGRGIRRWKPD